MPTPWGVYQSHRAKVDKQIAFGMARGLTQTAKAAADDVTRRLPSTFDRPTPFTMRAVSIEPAKRDNLQARVFVKDQQAKYLEVEETGGRRTPKPGAPVNIPAEAKLNAYGNLPRRAIKGYKRQKDVFFADGSGKTAHLKPGVYRRAERGERRDGTRGTKDALRHGGEGKGVGGSKARGATSLELLVAFKPLATYRPRFGFRKSVTDVARRQIEGRMMDSVRAALRTAK